MDFDPTYNYGDMDLEEDENSIRWNFGELIKNLVTLSSTADKQIKIIGIGAPCDEMAIDFETYFNLSYKRYLANGLLNAEQLKMLKELDIFFDERSGDKSPEFWNDFLLETNPEWQIVRQKAKSILALLGMSDLAIEYDREEEYKMTNKGKQLTMQLTKTRLIKQRSI